MSASRVPCKWAALAADRAPQAGDQPLPRPCHADQTQRSLTLSLPCPPLLEGQPGDLLGWSCGLMDKALILGTKDCRFESCQDQ